MIDKMEDSFHSDVFGVEKESGKVEGILAAVYQDLFGGDICGCSGRIFHKDRKGD